MCGERVSVVCVNVWEKRGSPQNAAERRPSRQHRPRWWSWRSGGSGGAERAGRAATGTSRAVAQPRKLLSDSVRSLQKDLAESASPRQYCSNCCMRRRRKSNCSSRCTAAAVSRSAPAPAVTQQRHRPTGGGGAQWLKWPLDASAQKLFGWLVHSRRQPSSVLPSSPGHRTLTPSAVSPSRGPAEPRRQGRPSRSYPHHRCQSRHLVSPIGRVPTPQQNACTSNSLPEGPRGTTGEASSIFSNLFLPPSRRRRH